VSLVFLVETVELRRVLGMGMGRVPLQYFHVPFVSRTNCTPRRQREYSGPEAHDVSIGTPGRRGEVSVIEIEALFSWMPKEAVQHERTQKKNSRREIARQREITYT